MPKKSKRKDKNTGKSKTRASDNRKVESDVSASRRHGVQYRENPVKPDVDPNEYRVIELPNGLVALLISSPTPSVEKEYTEPNGPAQLEGTTASKEQQNRCPAVCCLCVNAGSFSDPRQVPGVSLVLATAVSDPIFRNGPEISSECKKILKQPGARQLVPLSEATIFYIQATHRVYREAIERLGHSLGSAFISKEQTETSRRVVLLADDRKTVITPQDEKAWIFSQCVSKRHPAKTFGAYYLERLRQVDDDKVYREVQKFRKRHYSAHRMTVVMKAELPLDTLETYAKECFSRITNNRLPPEFFNSYNFANSVEHANFRKIWLMHTADCEEINVKWIMPPSSWLYRTKSLEFLSWLFSRGGAGSLKSYLEMKKWATDVRGRVLTEPAWNTSLYSTFCVSVTLTEIGNSENKLDVLDAIYSYINFLKREGPQKSIYDDLRIIRNAEFRYREAGLRDLTDFAQLAADMHVYPSTNYLAAPSFWYEYDPVSLSTCLDLMTPTKACIVLTDDNFADESYIKLTSLVRYPQSDDCTDVPEEWMDRWQTVEPLPDFKLPERNIFCPDDLRIIDAPAVLRKYPIKVHSDSMSEVWYRFDPKFRGPECHMKFCYVNPLPLESPENAAMQALFVLVLGDLTNEELDPALVAGLSCTMESYFLGLTIGVSGYTQKLPILAQLIRNSHHSLTKGLFETKKEELLVQYSKSLRSDRTLAQEITRAITSPGHWITAEKHAALSCLRFERFQHFVKHFADHVYIKCLVEGNIAEADAVKNALRVVEVSQCGPLSRDMIPRARVNKIPRGKHCCTVKAFGLDCWDVTVENYYQFDDSSVELGGILRLVVAFLTNPSLRDTDASDLPLTASYRPAASEIGVNFYALGSVVFATSTIKARQIESLDAEIEEQPHNMRDYLRDGIGDKWKHARIAAESEEGDIFSNEFENNWEDIINGEYDFGKLSRQLDALRDMGLADIHKWIDYITDDSNFRKLSIRVVGDSYSRADFSPVKTQPAIYQLQYLTKPEGRRGNTSYNCIADIYKYKRQLEASSSTNVTS